MLVEQGWGRAGVRLWGTGAGNTDVTVGGGRESSGSEHFLYIPELPVDIQSRRRNWT